MTLMLFTAILPIFKKAITETKEIIIIYKGKRKEREN
jgi:hypothetical protein